MQLVALGAFAGVVAIVTPLRLAMRQGWARWEFIRPLDAAYSLLRVMTALIKFVWAALEELMFRGGLLPQLSKRVGPWAGLAITSALFSMAHLERTGSRAPDLGRVTFAGPLAWVGSSSQAGLFDLIVMASLAALLLAFFLRKLLGDLRWVKAA